MSNLLIPPFSIFDSNSNKNITLNVNQNSNNNQNGNSKSLDLYQENNNETEEKFKLNHSNEEYYNNMEYNILTIKNSEDNKKQELSEEDQQRIILNNNLLTEKLVQNILGINKYKKKRKIGNLKEGYLQFYGINPINRYNFTIDRYNEDVNKIHNITLTRVPIPKILSRFFDLFIFLSRILLGVFLIITYYFSSYLYKKNSNPMNKARLITYKKYLLDDNNFYTRSDKPSCMLVFVCIIFMFLSIFLIFSLYFVMLIPNCLFTIYLLLAVFINLYNKGKITNKAQSIFENMVFEPKLDDKCQLNDYIKINKIILSYYKGFSYYKRLKEVYKRKGKSETIHVMLYGNLFVREHNIINKSFLIQLLAFGIYLIIGYFIYFN